MSRAVFEQLIESLVCPKHYAVPLWYEKEFSTAAGVPWPDGEISCSEGCRWNVRGGIPLSSKKKLPPHHLSSIE